MWPILKSVGDRLQLRRRLACSFCRRDANAVTRLVGGASANICDSCITECVVVLQRDGGFALPDVYRRPSTH